MEDDIHNRPDPAWWSSVLRRAAGRLGYLQHNIEFVERVLAKLGFSLSGNPPGLLIRRGVSDPGDGPHRSTHDRRRALTLRRADGLQATRGRESAGGNCGSGWGTG